MSPEMWKRLGLSIKRNHGLLRVSLKGFGTGTLKTLENSCEKIKYQEFQRLELPPNYKNLPNSEKCSFSRQRARDISGTYLATISSSPYEGNEDVAYDNDLRTEKYNDSGSVNLSSSMETNVPHPFQPNVQTLHSTTSRGHWRQTSRYISEQLHICHHVNVLDSSCLPLFHSRHFFKTTARIDANKNASGDGPSLKDKNLTRRQKLQASVKEYGATIVLVHIGLSLTSLGICYALITSGIDLEEWLKEKGWTSEGATTVGVAAPFLIAYAVHKALAPFRIGLTLSVTPIVVKFLRKRGFKVRGK